MLPLSIDASGRKAIHFSSMEGSTATKVREQLAALPSDTFLWSRDLAGPSAAVEAALARIAGEHEPPILRVRKGLYWRTRWTRFGPSRPSVFQTALEIAGPGAGPASVAAAHALGVTTQVPSVIYIAVPGRAPRQIRGARFFARPYYRRELDMRPMEVAVLEALRAGPVVVEFEWPEFVERIRQLADAGHIRMDVLRQAAPLEFEVSVRQQFEELDKAIAYATT
jgi:hypothetical protein